MDNQLKVTDTQALPVIVDRGVSILDGVIYGTSQLYIHKVGPDVATKPLIFDLRKSGYKVTTLGAPCAFEDHVWMCAWGGESSYLLKLSLDLVIVAGYQAPFGATYYNAGQELLSAPEGLYTFYEQEGGNHSFDLHLSTLTHRNYPNAFSSFDVMESGHILASIVHGSGLWVPRLYEIDLSTWVGARGMDSIFGQWDFGHEHYGCHYVGNQVVVVPVSNTLHCVELTR